jgi:hypothetical protein
MCGAREQQRSARVAEVVLAYIGYTSTLQQEFKVPAYDVLGVEGSAMAGGEHEAIILPVCAYPNPSCRVNNLRPGG